VQPLTPELSSETPELSSPKPVRTSNKDINIPAFVDQELWKEFLAMRKKLRAVNSDRAINALLNKIEKFHADGIDVNQLIENSVVNSWKDIYPPRKENGNAKGKSNTSPTALELATNLEW
jgi:hypothetical protein